MEIDLAKLRSRLRRLDREHHLMLLDRALELLPPQQVPDLVRDFFRVDELRLDGPRASVLDEVRAFCAAALDGEFYEDFLVNSRNCMTHSHSTAAFIAECQRLLRALCRTSDEGELQIAREGFELVFDVLREIDKCERDIVFFADEAGAWQIGVHWREVLPAWFRCVAAMEPPEAFASVVFSAIEEFGALDRDILQQRATQLASADQRRALVRCLATDRGGPR